MEDFFKTETKLQIKRERLLQKIKPFINNPLIKVLTGIRRSGKTELLLQIQDELKKSGVPEKNIISLNFESLRFRFITNFEVLYDYILQKTKKTSGKLYIFLDEIQNVVQWEKAVNSFRVDFDSDIYITGSNSHLLSSEFATLLAGRYVSFEVYPFSFSEIKKYKILDGTFESDEKLFADYLHFGGFPQRFQLKTEDAVFSYLSDIYNSVVLKDVMERNKINNIQLLQKLSDFMLDNVALQFSANSISNKLKSEKISASTDTILNYLSFLQNAFIIRGVKRYDITGKKLLETNGKYFSSDIGLCEIARTSEKIDYSKLYENIVFLELKSRGYNIHIGKLGENEVDFIATRGNEKMYIQVAYLITSEDEKREFGNLEKINDNFPKLVISSDLADLSRKGIVHKNIISWLLE